MTALLLPLVSVFFRYMSLRGDAPDRATAWLRHRRSNHVVLLITLAAWCALWELLLVAALPHILFWILPILSTTILEGASRIADRAVLTRTWTATDILGLACWSTLAPPVALLAGSRRLSCNLGRPLGRHVLAGRSGHCRNCRTYTVALSPGDKAAPSEVRHAVQSRVSLGKKSWDQPGKSLCRSAGERASDERLRFVARYRGNG
jgi:hypothetical protein